MPFTGFAPENPTPWLFTHGIDILPTSGSDTDKTVAEVWQVVTVAGLRVDGLVRSRLFRCIDSLKTGTTISSDPGEQRVPQYFALHGTISSLT